MFENWDTPPSHAGKMEHVAIAIVCWILVAPLTSLFISVEGRDGTLYFRTLISKITFHMFFLEFNVQV